MEYTYFDFTSSHYDWVSKENELEDFPDMGKFWLHVGKMIRAANDQEGEKHLNDTVQTLFQASSRMPPNLRILFQLGSTIVKKQLIGCRGRTFIVVDGKNRFEATCQTEFDTACIFRMGEHMKSVFGFTYDPASDDCAFCNLTNSTAILIPTILPNAQTCPFSIRTCKFVKKGTHTNLRPGGWRLLFYDRHGVGSDGTDKLESGQTSMYAMDFYIMARAFVVAAEDELQRNMAVPSSLRHLGQLVEYVESLDFQMWPKYEPDNQAPIYVIPSTKEDVPRKAICLNPLNIIKSYGHQEVLIKQAEHYDLLQPRGKCRAWKSYKLSGANKVDEFRYSITVKAGHDQLGQPEQSRKVLIKFVKPDTKFRYARGVFHAAARWENIKRLIEPLSHKNLLEMLSFDARLFAFYFEIPPPSILEYRIDHSIDTQDMLRILRDITSALGYLASNNMVHGCVSPENIKYSKESGAVLAGFDYVMETGSLEHPVTALHFPPECFMGTTYRALPSIDMWSLGLSLAYIQGFPDKQGEGSGKWRVFNDKPNIYYVICTYRRLKHWMAKRLRKHRSVDSMICDMLNEDQAKRSTSSDINKRAAEHIV